MGRSETLSKVDVTDFFKKLRSRKDDLVTIIGCRRLMIYRFALIVEPGIPLGLQRPLEYLFAWIVRLSSANLVFILLLLGINIYWL